jgi:hypothetical protein
MHATQTHPEILGEAEKSLVIPLEVGGLNKEKQNNS